LVSQIPHPELVGKTKELIGAAKIGMNRGFKSIILNKFFKGK
jgi:hypothetical protein